MKAYEVGRLEELCCRKQLEMHLVKLEIEAWLPETTTSPSWLAWVPLKLDDQLVGISFNNPNSQLYSSHHDRSHFLPTFP
jgi:hypothetical protein